MWWAALCPHVPLECKLSSNRNFCWNLCDIYVPHKRFRRKICICYLKIHVSRRILLSLLSQNSYWLSKESQSLDCKRSRLRFSISKTSREVCFVGQYPTFSQCFPVRCGTCYSKVDSTRCRQFFAFSHI